MGKFSNRYLHEKKNQNLPAVANMAVYPMPTIEFIRRTYNNAVVFFSSLLLYYFYFTDYTVFDPPPPPRTTTMIIIIIIQFIIIVRYRMSVGLTLAPKGSTPSRGVHIRRRSVHDGRRRPFGWPACAAAHR